MPTGKIEEVKKEPENLSIVEEAKKIRDEIKAENDRRELILKQEQQLQAEKMLSSSAGQPIPQTQITEAEQKKKGAMEFWKGSEIEKAIQKHG